MVRQSKHARVSAKLLPRNVVVVVVVVLEVVVVDEIALDVVEVAVEEDVVVDVTLVDEVVAGKEEGGHASPLSTRITRMRMKCFSISRSETGLAEPCETQR